MSGDSGMQNESFSLHHGHPHNGAGPAGCRCPTRVKTMAATATTFNLE